LSRPDYPDIDEDWRLFCRGATDDQLREIIRRERSSANPDRRVDYEVAVGEAKARGMEIDSSSGLVL